MICLVLATVSILCILLKWTCRQTSVISVKSILVRKIFIINMMPTYGGIFRTCIVLLFISCARLFLFRRSFFLFYYLVRTTFLFRRSFFLFYYLVRTTFLFCISYFLFYYLVRTTFFPYNPTLHINRRALH